MARWQKDSFSPDKDIDPDDSGALAFIVFSLVTCLQMLAAVPSITTAASISRHVTSEKTINASAPLSSGSMSLSVENESFCQRVIQF
ncbi:MAG: hypothetical protein AAF653_00980, partial [Chloroflexota bacterium]